MSKNILVWTVKEAFRMWLVCSLYSAPNSINYINHRCQVSDFFWFFSWYMLMKIYSKVFFRDVIVWYVLIWDINKPCEGTEKPKWSHPIVDSVAYFESIARKWSLFVGLLPKFPFWMTASECQSKPYLCPEFWYSFEIVGKNN